jgi:hypothetical protein
MSPVAIVALLVAAVGCESSSDAEQASASAAPAKPSAAVGMCYDARLTMYSMWADGAAAVPCSQPHRAETFHVGTIDGAVEVRQRTQRMSELFAICAAKAKEFLGANWYDGRIDLLVTVPRQDAWKAGVRTYSCEAAEIDSIGSDIAIQRASSLRGALAAGLLLLKCHDRPNKPKDGPLVPAACDQPHDGEYVGAVEASYPPPAAGYDDQTNAGCWAALKAYVGMSSTDGWSITEIGITTEHWDRGRLTVRCFTHSAPSEQFTASVKGIGNRRPATT